MYVLVCYVPDSHRQAVKDALFASGAGALGSYSDCCWEVLGEGQFKPLPGSNPYVGAQGVTEHVGEWRIELVVDDDHAVDAVRAMKKAHPYETPAYHLIPVMTFEDVPDEIEEY